MILFPTSLLKRFSTALLCGVAVTGLFTSLFAAKSEDIFKWTLTEEKNAWVVSVGIPAQRYLYAGQTSIDARNSSGKEIKPLSSPVPSIHENKDSVYSGEKVFAWKYPKDKGALAFEISFQGCGESPFVCYPPGKLLLKTDKSASASSMSGNGKLSVISKLEGFKVFSSISGYLPEEEFLRFLRGNKRMSSDFLEGKSIYIIIFIVFFGGLMLNFTPCVLPLIPINLAIIGAEMDSKSRYGGFVRGTAYGLGMAVAYGVAGMVAVLSGARFGYLNSMSWFNFAIATVFMIFSLAMFNIFSIDFSRFGAKINPSASKKGTVLMAFFLGALAALLAGSCIAPVVLAVLLYSARMYSEGTLIGLLLPFLLGMGMALPWPFAGAGLSVMPKPGKWMTWVKHTFGVMIFLFAIYYAYIGFSLLPSEESWSPEAELEKLGAALDQSSKSGKPLLIDFWASWCKNCTQMERGTLKSPGVSKELEDFFVVKFRAEKPSDPQIGSVLDYFDIAGFPSYVILKPLSGK
ncbi:MAG: hypothetical protein A2020_01960 [Lentisphaerae bacterium GWF2_45_14]|nr:MAG: hypothetical protein A2020_01960 [Lentisphaerae bacterium GWF2_45_14]